MSSITNPHLAKRKTPPSSSNHRSTLPPSQRLSFEASPAASTFSAVNTGPSSSLSTFSRDTSSPLTINPPLIIPASPTASIPRSVAALPGTGQVTQSPLQACTQETDDDQSTAAVNINAAAEVSSSPAPLVIVCMNSSSSGQPRQACICPNCKAAEEEATCEAPCSAAFGPRALVHSVLNTVASATEWLRSNPAEFFGDDPDGGAPGPTFAVPPAASMPSSGNTSASNQPSSAPAAAPSTQSHASWTSQRHASNPFPFFGKCTQETIDLCQALAASPTTQLLVPVRIHASGQFDDEVDSTGSSLAVQSIESHTIALNHTASIYAESGISVDDAVATAAGLVNPIVDSALLPAMRRIGANTIHHLNHFCPRVDGEGAVRTMEKNAKGNIVFAPLMINADKQLSLLNMNCQPEFFLDGSFNRKFFEANKFNKNFKEGTAVHGAPFFTVLDMAGFTPEWTIAAGARWENNDAKSFMKQNGPVLASGHSLISLKGTCVNVFLNLMSTDLMARAKQAGFQPLFLLKNALCQKVTKKNFGVNMHQFSTLNLQPKSYLVLAAFYSGQGNNLKVISITGPTGDFLTLPNSLP